MSEEPPATGSSARAGIPGFLWRSKKFWLPPIVLAVILLILLYVLAGKSGVVAPFVYDLQ